MLQKILFIIFLFSFKCTYAQFALNEIRLVPCTTFEIPIYKNSSNVYEMTVKLNGISKKFIFDTGASNITFSYEFYNYMFNNSYITKSDIKGNTKTILANGTEVNATILILREVTMGNLVMKNIEAIAIDSKDTPFLLGQSILNKFGKVTIDFNTNKLIINKNNNIENIRKILKEDTGITISKFTEEHDIIPENALSNLPKSDIIIRFFHPDDEKKALYIKDLLSKQFSAETQSMLSKISKTKPNYIEIWIK